MSYTYVTLTGVVVPDDSAILTDVQNEYKQAFGQDLVVTPDTPQGVLITAEALARSSVAANNAQLANQINPNIAGGIFLDAIGALTGLLRIAQTYSTALVDLAGVAGTVIPTSVTVQNTNGDIFQIASQVTLDVTGEAVATVQAVEPGPITSLAGTITIIVNGVLGLETVNNPANATLGTTEQSDLSYRALRRNTLALQGMSLAEAITSGLYDTPNVTSLTFRENIATTTQVIDGVTMIGHSLYACVAGGTDLAVANTLTNKKSGGCAYNNGPGINKSVPITNQFSGQIITVLFDRPNIINILARVYVNPNTSVADPTDAVQTAILAYAAGQLPGDNGFVVGASVSSFELSGAVNQVTPGLFVSKVEIAIASGSPSFSTDEIHIDIWEQAAIIRSSITVIIT